MFEVWEFLQVEPRGFVDGLDLACERTQSRMTLEMEEVMGGTGLGADQEFCFEYANFETGVY